MLCEPVCHHLSGRNQSKKKHACQADVLFILCQGFWLFSVFRRSRLRGHRQIRRCDLHRSHRRGCRQIRRCDLHRSHRHGCCRRSHRSFRCQSCRRGRCCQIRQSCYLRNRKAVSAAGAGGDCRRSCRRYKAVSALPAGASGRPNGAGVGRAGDGVPRRWGDTPPSARPCRASCSGGDSGDNACHQA